MQKIVAAVRLENVIIELCPTLRLLKEDGNHSLRQQEEQSRRSALRWNWFNRLNVRSIRLQFL
jgi:hypothetical protein